MKALAFFVGTVTGVIGAVVASQLWVNLTERSVYTGRRAR